jgi:hypothetical protein
MTNKETEDYGFLFKGRQVGDNYIVSCLFCSDSVGDYQLRAEVVGRNRLEAFAKASVVVRHYLGGSEWHELLRSME